MRIRRLRLAGFKSFVDASELRIEPGLTGVVGPNGCGKSNLLEALRWAMGENSAKSLRGAGMEDVIFAGTATRPPRQFAEVSILADGTDADEEIEVVRRIERGAGSAYRINGRDVRAKDVALLFADAATGAHSPALVSQGRIGAVIAAKPADRRAMLEEAAGIAGLHVRRRDAEQRLRATETNLERLGTVIADQEARIAALRRQARHAERYRTLSDAIRVAEGRMIFARWRDAAAAADAAHREAEAAAARVAECQAAADALDRETREAADRLGTARAQALAMRDTATEAEHRLTALRHERAGAERRIAELVEADARIDTDRGREDALAHDAADALDRLASEARALDAAIADATRRTPELDAHLATSEAEARDAEVALARAIADQASEAAEVRVAQAALAAAEMRLDRAIRDRLRTEAERNAIDTVEPIAAERDRAAEARAVAERAVDRARAALADADAAERAAISARDRAQAARGLAHADLAAHDGEAAALRKAQQSPARDRLLDRLRAAPGYERAVAAALGDDLDSGIDAAAERHWAGAEPLPGDPSPPGSIASLSAHVDAPAQLARRLAQVFVAEHDDGRPLAVGQRLVTLAGAMRRWDGYVVSSGSAAAAERLERVNRLAALDRARPALETELDAAIGELAKVEAAITEARGAAAEARRTIEASDAAARAARRDEDSAAARIDRLAGQRTDCDARIARIALDLAEAEAETERASQRIAALPDGSAAQARVAALTGTAEAARASVAQARMARTEHERGMAQDRERHAAAIADARSWRTRAGDAAKRIADMGKRKADIDRERSALAERPAALAAEIADSEARAYAARDAAQAAQADEGAAEEALRTVETQARTAAEALSAAREARAGAAARAENQELRRVEMGRLSGERFQCPPPLLPERVGFEGGAVGTTNDEGSAHERLMLDRERIGPVNLVAEAELAEIDAERTTNASERDELTAAVQRLRGSIGTLNREGRQRLLAAFEAVDGHFRRLFTTLFNGGQARLELIDSDDPLEAGLEILAQPPGKKLQSLTLLSGGEQALTAVALIFGLFLTNPAPICVLDEVDAPLDDANIDRFCDLLDRMTVETDTRYLIVTHNATTMSRMHRLFGVTMVEQGISRLVSVDLGGAETLLAAE